MLPLTFGYHNSKEFAARNDKIKSLQNEKELYFTLDELLHSETAHALKLKNEPTEEQFNNLCTLVSRVLWPARRAIKLPIIVNSAFRSHPLNGAVGGKPHSRHKLGLAADIYCVDMRKLWRTLEALPHVELIQYKHFIHVSL